MTKILVIQNKRIGDVLIASILANNLKKIFPNSHISYFVYDYTAGVLEENPYIDSIIRVEERQLKKFSKLVKTIWEVRRDRYDIILDPYAKFQSRIICLFSGAPKRIGFKRKHKKLKFNYYTKAINFLDESNHPSGKAIEDRINMLQLNFNLPNPDYRYKIFLSEEEKAYNRLTSVRKPVVMVGALGSTRNKSLPPDYVAELIDFIVDSYDASILLNYAPHQLDEIKDIIATCRYRDRIQEDIYEDSIRGFIKLMNQCDALVANEGGAVHIAKALNKPTFTIYSPFIEKSHWNSFEDGIEHDSIHLKEIYPELFQGYSREERKKIESDPTELYRKLSPALIIEKLGPFLDHQLKKTADEPHR